MTNGNSTSQYHQMGGHQQRQLTIEMLQDLRDQLKQPLHNRPILLPLGRKAFVSGRLQNKDTVVVRMPDGTTEKTMSRQEALIHLQNEIDRIRMEMKATTSSNKKDMTSKTDPTNSKSLHNQLDKPMAVATTTTAAAAAAAPTVTSIANDTASVLPFIEIREVLNEVGEEVDSEIIDVSSQLETLQQGKKTTIKSASIAPTSENQSTMQVQNDDLREGMEIISEPKLKRLSDAEYDALTTRLEELAQIEARSERDKATNLISSQKLQSSGWSKGFFNKPKGTKEEKLIQSGKPVSSSTKKVAFGENQVREIPSEVESTNQSRPSRPIEKSIFSGIVQEKKSSFVAESNKTERHSAVQLQLQQQSVTMQPTKSPVAPPKRLSRFAQERQQMM